jgi:hypothetical protein
MSLAGPAASTELVLSHYRGITLGDSVPVVVERLQLPAADVKVVQERPTVVQEVTWRPHRFVSGASVKPDALAEMVLTFHMGRLARIAVTYDRERTQGMTNADLHEAMGPVYGTSLLIAAPTQSAITVTAPLAERQTIGQWEDAETLLLLWRDRYPNRVGLTITSIAADRALQQAITDGVRLHAAEAPGRELARQTADAAAIEARDAKSRRDNKATFKP